MAYIETQLVESCMYFTLHPAASAYPPPTRITISHGINLWKSFQLIMGASGSGSESSPKGTKTQFRANEFVLLDNVWLLNVFEFLAGCSLGIIVQQI